MPRFLELKIKIKSLAEEARIIRKEERSLKRKRQHTAAADGFAAKLGQTRIDTLNIHRTIDVRDEARATLLAYAYLRGKAYADVEPSPRCNRPPYDRRGPKWERVRDMISKYDRSGKLDVWADGRPVKYKDRKDAAWELVKKWRESAQ